MTLHKIITNDTYVIKNIPINSNFFSINSFMSNKRKKKIMKEIKYMWEIEYKNKKKETKLYFFTSHKNINKYNSLINKIFGRVTSLRYIFNNNKFLEIWIYPSRYKKKITNPITIDGINSGSTIITLNKNDKDRSNGKICIWRSEELLKVLVHEIIHAFRVDEKFRFPKETYVEWMALTFNIYMELHENNLPMCHFNKLYEEEKKFALDQANSIKYHKNNKTNIHYYITEKARLMNNLSNKKFNQYLNKTPIPELSKSSFKFTMTSDLIKSNYFFP